MGDNKNRVLQLPVIYDAERNLARERQAMSMEMKRKLQKTVLLATKIAIGCGVAMYIAEALHLENAASAGTVTLLSLLGTKWETVKSSFIRFGTFFFTILLVFLLMPRMHSEWIAYGIIIFIMVFLFALIGWKSMLSVNAIIAAHYMTKLDFGMGFLMNEFMLVLIGVVIAFLLNLFHLYKSQKKDLIGGMRYTEESLRSILRELTNYLLGRQQVMSNSVWEDICALEKKLRELMEEAREYQDNTFESHHDYYLDYFEMRLEQCRMLNSLHYEMKKIRTMPKQAKVIADYIAYLADRIAEKNVAKDQLESLNRIFADMKKEELPKSREEFESRALLYHTLMDIEEFLKCKISFVENLSERQRKEYWE